MGKPVYNRYANVSFGSWMKDPILLSVFNETIWMTIKEERTLLEFSNKSVFKADVPTKKHLLKYPFHVSNIKSINN